MKETIGTGWPLLLEIPAFQFNSWNVRLENIWPPGKLLEFNCLKYIVHFIAQLPLYRQTMALSAKRYLAYFPAF